MRVKTIYERPRLARLLDEAGTYPLAIVVAGAGFGKTTAVREWLKRSSMASAWVGVTDDDATVLWEKVCDAIDAIDTSAADELRTTGIPHDPWEISRIVKIARRRCTAPLVICMDDVHLLSDDNPALSLIGALAFEQIENLHILLVTRREPALPMGTLLSKDLCAKIDETALRFDRDETAGYLSMRGLRLTGGAIDQICLTSNGWISAIYLISEGIRSGGSIAERKNIDRLFSENLMDPLSETEREILARVAPLEPLPGRCAVAAIGDDQAKRLLDELVSENAFVSVDERGVYSFHPLFREFLMKRCPDDAFQRDVYRRAGLWYLGQSERFQSFSVELFEKAGCVEELLENLDRPGIWSLNYSDMQAICSLADHLPDDECIAHPFPSIQIIFYLLLSGDAHGVRMAKHQLETMQAYFSSHAHPHRDTILGELLVISRVTGFGSIPEGTEPLEEASRLLGGRPSTVLSASDPFTFGLPMLLESEWMAAGELETAVRRCQYNPYELVTNGFGRGSEQLVLAEAALLRCQMDEARIWAEQADAEAAEYDQWFVMASARFTLMRRALHLNDEEDAVLRLASIRSLVPEAERNSCADRMTVTMLREAVALSECFLATSVASPDEIPGGFIDGTHRSKMVGLGIPEAFSARAMLAVKNPSGAERMCRRLDHQPSVCQEARLIGLILQSLTSERLHGKGAGIPTMRVALEEAQADGVVLPFVENPGARPLLDAVGIRGCVDDAFLSQVREAFRKHPPIDSRRLPLSSASLPTARELEVLRLAAQGLTRAQIASQICVKEDTVKKHLSSVYRKLGASNRTQALRIARINGLL